MWARRRLQESQVLRPQVYFWRLPWEGSPVSVCAISVFTYSRPSDQPVRPLIQPPPPLAGVLLSSDTVWQHETIATRLITSPAQSQLHSGCDGGAGVGEGSSGLCHPWVQG